MRAPQGLVADVIRFSWVDGPGNRFVVFMQGCGWDCAACHNPHTIPTSSVHARWVSVPELIGQVRPVAGFLSGVTVSGGEATRQPEFVRAFFGALAADDELSPLTRFIDTNGSASSDVWDRLLPVTDGVMVDLKALDPELHLRLTGSGNAEVLATIRQLSAVGKLHEVRLLLVPGINDDDLTLTRTGRWLTGVDPDLRVVVLGFRRHGARAPASSWPEATEDDRVRYAATLSGAGVRRLEVV